MKNCTTLTSAQTWVTVHCYIGTFLMRAERKVILPRETLIKKPTNTTAHNLVRSQTVTCLACQNL